MGKKVLLQQYANKPITCMVTQKHPDTRLCILKDVALRTYFKVAFPEMVVYFLKNKKDTFGENLKSCSGF